MAGECAPVSAKSCQRFRHEIAGTAVCEIIGRSHPRVGVTSRPYEFAPMPGRSILDRRSPCPKECQLWVK